VFVHKVAEKARAILPRSWFHRLRGVATALLTPVSFSYQTGHLYSSLKAKAVDKSGAPLPWYTYPAIDFLSTKDFAGRSVLEFGAGQSTLWWAQRAARVLSFESDSEWYQALKRYLPESVCLIETDNQVTELERVCNGDRFDVIVIDGLNRFTCAHKALAFWKDGGAIIVDNSEGFWGPDGHYPIMDLFRHYEFSRIDFYGYAPGVILPACTSLFFKEKCFLLSGSENPKKIVH
jgi:hypothetical protein